MATSTVTLVRPDDKQLDINKVDLREIVRVTSEKWKKGLLLNGGYAPEGGIQLHVPEDDSRFIRGKNDLAHIKKQSVQVGGVLNEELFDSEFRINLPPVLNVFRLDAGIGGKRHAGWSVSTRNEKSYTALYVACAKIYLHADVVGPTEEFQAAITDALRQQSDDHKHQYLTRVFQRYGYCYPSEIWIDEAVERKTKRSMEAKLGVDTYGTGAGVNATIESLQARVKRSVGKDSSTQVTGGDGHLIAAEGGLASWISSIDKSPDVIRLTDFKPIYELLNSEEAEEIRRVYYHAENRDYIRQSDVVTLRNGDTPCKIFVDDTYYVKTESFINCIPQSSNNRIQVLSSNPLSRNQAKFQLVTESLHAFENPDDCLRFGDTVKLKVLAEGSNGFVHAMTAKLGSCLPPTFVVTGIYPPDQSTLLGSEEWYM
ncbi:hypothetical protein EC973_000261 [Apophysomyces ossiformis]|uniref:MACPF-like domain-containing protein n=1 Tax=Apophysomyces ossiformis TaxID=679940 RepID=A0A8H7EV96_9FUNG|nr:hypothetical protein EC973_000261 [Apophysomyces ossiformis]